MTSYNTLISAADLQRLGDEPGLRLVDCRFDLANEQAGPEAYLAGHIPGAVYAHLHADLAAPVTTSTGRHPLPDPAVLAQTLGRWGIDAHSQVVVYDEGSGAIASRLWWMLRWLGHAPVAVLDGGFAGWIRSGGACVAGAQTASPARFTPDPQPHMSLDSEQVTAGLTAGSLLLIDVRARGRFLGESEPLDKVAGHVPGAVNLPYQENLDADGTFKSAGALKALYEQLREAHPGKQIAFMCGSGVTACHGLLAMQVAGLPDARLYAGSWSDWITDPARPVALGE